MKPPSEKDNFGKGARLLFFLGCGHGRGGGGDAETRVATYERKRKGADPPF